MYVVKLCIFVIFSISVDCLTVQDLGGVWLFEDEKQEYKNLYGNVPGGIYTDLMNNKVIDDVFFGNNDIESRWVAKRSWTYSRSFEVSDDLLDHEQINLVFDGVDTFAKISINNNPVGNTENMFLGYAFDVKDALKSGINTIAVAFESPLNKANESSDAQHKNYAVPPECVPEYYNGECHVNYIRKMQASFSWDWGPALPSMGIWKPVRLEAYNNAIITDVTVKLVEQASDWEFTITTYFSANKLGKLQGQLVTTVFSDMDRSERIDSLNLVSTNELQYTNTFTLPKGYFKLWWPNGYGDQPLYTLRLTYVSPDGQEQSNKKLKIGFRTIEVVQDMLDSGRNFYFKVNGVPIFAKGSNLIPINILPELSQDEAKIRKLLQASKDVHMNMLRVWGGGVYESDTFYSVADEMGILIWQDFMFACSMYPANNDFLSNVEREVQYQVRRLQHHPSIAMWAGNNENEVALRQSWYGTSVNFEQYKTDYVKLYVDTVGRKVLENDDTRVFLTSSPTNGVASDDAGYVADQPQSNYFGDVHYYNYLLDSWNQNIYPITRFASEYGYQALPSVSSIMTATNNTGDLSYSSDFLLKRQHHTGGYTEILNMIKYRLDLIGSDQKNFDRAYIFYSQIIQAVAIKLETEYYRQWRSYRNSVGEGNTMGALYWQLNDVWIAPTWSGIDFTGKWKMLHYYAKDFFAPTIVTAHYQPSGDVDVYVVSDTKIISNANLKISVYNWNSFVPVGVADKAVDIGIGSKKVTTFWLQKYLEDNQCGTGNDALQNCFLYFSLNSSDGTPAGPNNLLMPKPLKDSAIQNAEVKISEVGIINDKEFSITITTNKIAAFVWLETSIPGTFSENGFFQIEKEKKISFFAETETNQDDLQKDLTVTHLRDAEFQNSAGVPHARSAVVIVLVVITLYWL